MRLFTLCLVVLSSLTRIVLVSGQSPNRPHNLEDVTIRNLISRAEIQYSRPARDEEEGLPIGNGRMGTLVWTTPQYPATLRYQLNRNDTFGMDRSHRHYDPEPRSGQKVETTDNVLSLCRLGVRLGKVKFIGQTLSPQDGAVNFRYDTADGEIGVRTFVAADRDVLVVQVNDPCPPRNPQQNSEDVGLVLEMVRKPSERHGDNLREYHIKEQDGRVVILQTVREGKFFMHYAVAVGVIGGKLHATETL